MEKIIIKREWKNTEIRVGLNDKEIYIESSVESFVNRVTEITLEKVPNLSWTVSKDKIKLAIEKSVMDALSQVIMEMKKETLRIV